MVVKERRMNQRRTSNYFTLGEVEYIENVKLTLFRVRYQFYFPCTLRAFL